MLWQIWLLERRFCINILGYTGLYRLWFRFLGRIDPDYVESQDPSAFEKFRMRENYRRQEKRARDAARAMYQDERGSEADMVNIGMMQVLRAESAASRNRTSTFGPPEAESQGKGRRLRFGRTSREQSSLDPEVG